MPSSVRVWSKLLLAWLLIIGQLVFVLPALPAAAQVAVEVRSLAAGTAYETPMYVIRSPHPGPVFLLIGGVHGSEIAGWMAAWRFVNREIVAGTLIVIPEANRPAVEQRVRNSPIGGYDLNRVFPATAGSEPTRLIAREIWRVFTNYRVEWLLDLHEALDFYRNPAANSVGQTIIHYPSATATPLGRLAVEELNRGISVPLHQFTLLRYPVQGSIARAAGAFLGVNSYIFETSRRLPLAERIGYQVQVVEIFLRELGMTGTAAPPPAGEPPGEEPPSAPGEGEDDPGTDPPSALVPGLNLLSLRPGTTDETTVYAWESGSPGPSVLVVGGLRGDEPGAVAAARVAAQLQVTAGRLLVLPEAYRRAIAAGTRTAAAESDLNRAFPRSAGVHPTSALAAAIWQLFNTYGIDHVISFVEDPGYHQAGTGDFGQTIVYYPNPGTEALAQAMAAAANLTIDRQLATFGILRPPVLGSLARSAGEWLGAKSFLVVLTSRESLEARAGQGLAITEELLAQLGMKERVPLPAPLTRILFPGTPHATTLQVMVGREPGPTILVVGGLRGDEPGGVAAARLVSDFRIRAGRVLVLSEANRTAIAAGTRTPPGGVDLNRAFPQVGGETPTDPVARGLWSLVREESVDYLVSFVEEDQYHLAGLGHSGQTIIHFPVGDSGSLAQAMATAVNRIEGRNLPRFTVLRNPVRRSMARAAGEVLGIPAFLVVLCRRQQPAVRADRGARIVDGLLTTLNLAAPVYPEPVPPPLPAGVSREWLAPDTQHATPLYRIDSGQPGPVILMVGGLRGNEIWSANATQQLLTAGWRPQRGSLLLLPEANRLALDLGQAAVPGEGDLNRAFPMAAGQSPIGPLASGIWEAIRRHRVTHVLTFTEGADYYRSNRGEFGQTVIYHPVTGGERLADRMVADLNAGESRTIARWTALRGPVRGSLARAAGEFLGLTAFLVEVSARERLQARVRWAEQAMSSFAGHTGVR
jgi:predicted deacylase